MNISLKFKKTIIAIDFDGTIVDHEFPDIGELRKDSKEVINRLYDEDYYIIIWTCRAAFQLIEAIKFLNENNIKYHKINENADFDIIGFKPSPKIFYNILIDDAMLGGIPKWKEIYKRITNKEFIDE